MKGWISTPKPLAGAPPASKPAQNLRSQPHKSRRALSLWCWGLSPHGWGDGPGDTYDWHEHGYEKVLYCVRGQILFHTASGDIGLGGVLVVCHDRARRPQHEPELDIPRATHG